MCRLWRAEVAMNLTDERILVDTLLIAGNRLYIEAAKKLTLKDADLNAALMQWDGTAKTAKADICESPAPIAS